MKVAILSFAAAVFGVLCLFFCWYTVRLIYINVAVAGVAEHRRGGMYIGAVAFPVATLIFGWLCFQAARAAARQ